jgi:RNA polymerase sigma factor (sigma-70 family)
LHPQDGIHEKDLELVRAIEAGSLPAWHGFVDRYTGLLYAVISRYVFDREEIRNVYIDVLTDLYRGKLHSYQGRSALSTWLVPLARNSAIDHVRKRLGRQLIPDEIRQMGEAAVQIYQLYFLEGLSLEAVIHRMGKAATPKDHEMVVEILSDVENKLHPRTLRTLSYRAHAMALGETSAKLLEFLDSMREEMEDQSAKESPEYSMMEAEARETVARVLAMVEQLTPDEREVLTLHYREGLTAKEIAERMNVDGPRKVYLILERTMRKLRAWLDMGLK